MSAMRVYLILVFFFCSLYSAEEIAKADSPVAAITPPIQDGYTINYNTVSIIEYVRFASKICKINFIYEETDLNFTITVVSDEPVTAQNVMATLVQVLRIHGLELLEQGGSLVIHKSPNVKQMATLVTDATQNGNAPIVTRIFRVKNAKPDSIAAVIRPMISTSAILESSPETRQLILTDVTANVDKIAALIENLDSPHTLLEIKSFDAHHNSPEFLIEVGNQIMNPIAQGNPFILVPQTLANAIFIVSTPDLVEKAVGVFTSLDVPPKKDLSNATARKLTGENVFVYKVINRSGDEVVKSLANIASNLQQAGNPEPELITAINTAKWIRETNSIMIVGSKDSIGKIKEFLMALDVKDTLATMDNSNGKELKNQSTKNNFFIYKIQAADAATLQASLKNFGKTLDKTHAGDAGLIKAINGMKFIKENNSLLFTGGEADLKQIETLVPTFDTGIGQIPASSQFYIYKPVHQTGEQLVSSLKDISSHLKSDHLSDPAFLHSLESVKWVKTTHSLMFTGDPNSVKKIETLIISLDVPKLSKNGYYIYKVQNTTGDVIEEDLDAFAKNLKASGVPDAKVLDTIAKMRYVKETNSLLLSGEAGAIEEVKALIVQYDYSRTQGAAPAASNFFMFKPVHVPVSQIEQSLKDISANLKKAGLADPNLLTAIDTAKLVTATNSIIFTGTPDALQKIQTLIKDIDIPPAAHAPIQHIGKTTFLLYKLKNASGPQIVTSLKNLATDLKKSSSDKDLAAALSTMKFVKETQSLLFTGTEDALTKVQALVEKFDVTNLALPKIETIPMATNFFVYKPHSLAGPDLEKILSDFSENLKSSGLSDPELFNAIASSRWNDKTQTFVFAGSPKALDQIKALLLEFDIPSNLPGGLPKTPLEPTIQAIDNISFLVYKLQFHKGDEIQGALRQIAKDLILTNAPVNKGLLNSINSIQWLEVTNSLLSSGDQETLTRLRELIKNLDIPLRQVFIEVLVIETDLTNALSFGLEWGANYKFRNKFASSMTNTAPNFGTSSSSSSFNPDTTMTSLGTLVPPTAPTPQMLPASGTGAFDLGVIGEVIRHRGQTFLTLASLLQALQSDTETSVIDTPKILTQDGRTSTIFVGRNIPFVGSFVSNSQSASNTIQSTNIEYRDIGLNLTITPVLGNSDIVTLDINLDRSQTLTNVTQASLTPGQTANGIITSKTTMQTTVHVPDDNFLILSGAVLNSSAKVKSGFPCLGGLPLVGALFSQSNDLISNTNIVIFLRPHIINSLDDLRNLSHNQEEFFRDQAGTPFLERSFDNGMEMIKTADDE